MRSLHFLLMGAVALGTLGCAKEEKAEKEKGEKRKNEEGEYRRGRSR